LPPITQGDLKKRVIYANLGEYDAFYMDVNDCPESAFKLIILINQNDVWCDPEC